MHGPSGAVMHTSLRAVVAALAALATALSAPPAQPLARPPGLQSVAGVLRALDADAGAGAAVRGWFADAGAAFPPRRLDLVVLKAERRLELWAPGPDGRSVRVHTTAVLAASGSAGPKLREGDQQVPEGVYGVRVLNPNSRFHLSFGIDYPNALDRAAARADGRSELGGDIYFHGGAASIGCVAVGDAAIEPLFWLVARTGKARVRVLIAPWDLRAPGAEAPEAAATTLGAERYRALAEAMGALVEPAPAPRTL